MDLEAFRSKLEQLHQFTTQLSLENDQLSNLDKAKIKQQLVDLYDALLDAEISNTTIVKQSENKKQNTSTKKPVTNITTPSEKVVVIEEEDEEEENIVPLKSKEKPVDQPKEEISSKTQSASEYKNEDQLNELFTFEKVTELSEKLSSAPIKDLMKAMGLNEKFLYIKELFGGDIGNFQSMMNALNEADGLGSAKDHLKELIIQHEWMDKNKIKIAKDFIKLVRRRYL